MADDYNLLQKISDAGNEITYTSIRNAAWILRMVRAIQEHDAKQADVKSDRRKELTLQAAE